MPMGWAATLADPCTQLRASLRKEQLWRDELYRSALAWPPAKSVRCSSPRREGWPTGLPGRSSNLPMDRVKVRAAFELNSPRSREPRFAQRSPRSPVGESTLPREWTNTPEVGLRAQRAYTAPRPRTYLDAEAGRRRTFTMNADGRVSPCAATPLRQPRWGSSLWSP